MKIGLNKMESNAVTLFRNLITKNLQDEISWIILFGSRARGDFRKDSDIDVFILLNKKSWEIRDRIYDSLTETILRYDVNISLRIYSQKEYQTSKSMGSPFIHNLEKEGIVLWKKES